MMDLFSTGVLTRVVANLQAPQSFLLDRFFGEVQTEDSEEIHFDLDDGKRRIAPFVSPVVAGKVVASQGYQTKTFKPAYVKDKRVFDSSRPLKRSIGEQIGGTLAPMDRVRALVARDLDDQVSMITRRLEVMAAEILRTGKVTVTGDLYPTVVVDFGRDAALTITLSGSQRWGQSGVKPLDLLQDWALLVTQKCGAMPIDVVMDVAAWKVFRADPDIKERLDRFRGASTMAVDAKVGEGGTFMGNVDGFNIWVYAGWYVDPADGSEKPILPSGAVLLSGPQLEGVRAFGAIRDEQAGFQAMPYFPKSWLEQDPAVRYLMTQSAPLVVPYRVNGCLAATVL